MMKSKNHTVTIVCLIGLLIPSISFAAKECRIQYGWNTGNSFQGTFKNHSKKIYLNKGQTKNINKNRMNYVKNLKTREVKFYLKNGASNVTLGKNQRNPVVGTYVNTPKLTKVKCLNSATSSPASPTSPQGLIQNLKSQNVPIKNIAIQLNITFNKSHGQIVQLLKSAGFNLSQIAGAIDSAFNLSPGQVLSALKQGYSNLTRKQAATVLRGLQTPVSQVVTAVKDILGGTINQLAAAIYQAGFKSQNELNKIATRLKTDFNARNELLFGALRNAGYQLERVVRALIKTVGVTLRTMVGIMKKAGIPGSAVASAIVDAGIGATEITLTAAFKVAGFVADVTMKAIKLAFNAPARIAARAFKLANYSVDVTTRALKSVYKLTRAQAEQALKYAGYQASQILAALNKYYGIAKKAGKNVQQQASAIGVADCATAFPSVSRVPAPPIGSVPVPFLDLKKCAVLMKSAKKSAAHIAAVLKTYFKQSNTKVAQLLQAVRFTANLTAKGLKDGAKATADQTTAALKSVFRLTRDQAKAALQYAGYTARQIQIALNRYYVQARVAVERTANNVQRRVNTAQTGMALAAPAVAAAVTELQGWLLKAEINKRKCRINATNAIGTPGVLRSPYRWKRLVKAELKKAGLSDTVATKWDVAFKRAFTDWASNVTIPGLPWYPAFAAYPSAGNARLKPAIGRGSITPPLPNIPTPLGTLVSRFTPGMAPPNLKKTITSALGSNTSSQTKDAVTAFATQIGGRFSKYLATAQVMLVYGSGRVQLAPGSSVGPVVGGSCWGTNILSTSAMSF